MIEETMNCIEGVMERAKVRQVYTWEISRDLQRCLEGYFSLSELSHMNVEWCTRKPWSSLSIPHNVNITTQNRHTNNHHFFTWTWTWTWMKYNYLPPRWSYLWIGWGKVVCERRFHSSYTSLLTSDKWALYSSIAIKQYWCSWTPATIWICLRWISGCRTWRP